MELEADLIEELARFHGYQNIPISHPPGKSAGMHSPAFAFEEALRRSLGGLGYSEAVNLSFATAVEHEQFPPADGGERARILNPLTEDTEFLRTTLSPGLVKSARRNFNYGQRLLRLFEVGKVYRTDPEGTAIEKNALGILGTGASTDLNWLHPSPDYSFFHMKGVIVALMQQLRSEPFEIVPTSKVAWLDASAAAAVISGGQTVGVFGALHPDLSELYKIRQPLYLAEFDCAELSRRCFRPVQYEPIPKLPSVVRDLSIVLDLDIHYDDLRSGILGLGITELVSIELIDVYEGEKIPEGKLGLTLRLTFQDRERTLTVDRVQGFGDNILTFLRNTYGAELR
jgi:phenylalanyl-tRNA synthetase beta chain